MHEEHAGARLRRILWAIYGGERVVAQAAAAFRVNRRTVERWLTGEHHIPLRVWSRLCELPGERAKVIQRELRRQQVEGWERIGRCIDAGNEAKRLFAGAQQEERRRRERMADRCRGLSHRRRTPNDG